MHPETAFLLRQLAPLKSALLLATLMLLAESAVTLATPVIAGRVAQELLGGELPARLLLLWLAVMGLQALLAFGGGVVQGGASSRLAARLGSDLYDRLQALPVRWHQERRRGETLSLLSGDVARIAGFVPDTLVGLLPNLLTFAGALFLLMRIDARIGLVLALGVPLFVLALKLVIRRLRPIAAAAVHEEGVKHGMAEQNLSVLPLIKSFTRELAESERYAAQGRKVQELETRQLALEAFIAPFIRWAGAAGIVLLVWLGGGALASGTIAAAELVTVLLLGMVLVQPASQLAAVYGRLQAARASALRLREVFAAAAEPDTGSRTPEPVLGAIGFEQVRFAYPGQPPLFTALDLEIAPGETIAITGPNGAGKTTLAHLLLRFVDPEDGRITLDGVDLRELSLRHLRAQIGLVSQQVLLLNASIGHNIGYGRLGATPSQIEAAARAAHAHAFIERLPQGYDSVVGDDGVRLSGGQKQRIALARALLKDPAILVLDEATAMFDPEGEAGFIAECRELLRTRTVIMITHRPASLALADRVLRLEHGELVEVARKTPS